MLRVAVESLGCKLNQAEIEILKKELAGAGCRMVTSAEEADIYILNTCTVTHIADHKSRHTLRQAHRLNPDARLIAIGCYAERASAELEQIEGVDLVIGNKMKSHLVKQLEEAGILNLPLTTDLRNFQENGCRTRAFIKIQDGCHNFCAYCIVPLVRRQEESVPVDHIKAEVRERVNAGFQEIVLTGTEIGSYNCDGLQLKGLLERILAETPLRRLRMSSLQPQEVTPGFIALWQDKRLCPHFHLSLQSGSYGVLKRMKRRYSLADYQRAVSLIRRSVPDVSITTDVIVGFPAETEAEFQESLDFYRQMEFARIHVFPFSSRPGTEAAHMEEAVTEREKGERCQQMLALAKESLQQFNRRFLGRTMEVLWERKASGVWSGLTGNYIRIYARNKEELTNKLLPVKMMEICEDGLLGEIV